MSVVRSRSSVWAIRPCFLIFCEAGCVGRKSATAAAMITVVDQARRMDNAFNISSAVATDTTSTPLGVGNAVGPVTRTTWAPLAWAASATA